MTASTEENVVSFYGLNGYEIADFQNMTGGNMYYNGAKPAEKETSLTEIQHWKPTIEIEEKGDEVFLVMEWDASMINTNTTLVTTKLLGQTIISEAIFENAETRYLVRLRTLREEKKDIKYGNKYLLIKVVLFITCRLFKIANVHGFRCFWKIAPIENHLSGNL